MQILYTHTNIFDIPITNNGSEAVCITTNGMIKKNGMAVMGAGIAKEANERYNLAGTLAEYLRQYGNHAYILGKSNNGFYLISFPTKNHWKDNSNINLIKQSAYELITLCNYHNIKRCYLTPPGCSNGHLNWEYQVKPVLENILDDRFIIVIRN